jgi:hypothetical protein
LADERSASDDKSIGMGFQLSLAWLTDWLLLGVWLGQVGQFSPASSLAILQRLCVRNTNFAKTSCENVRFMK